MLEIAVITKILEGEQILEKGEFEGFLRSLQSVAGERERGAYSGLPNAQQGSTRIRVGKGHS